MSIAPDASKASSWLVRALTTDFCPWANRFVYWLKEPVGWFVLATAASVMIGAFLAPIGWTLAAALAAVILVGMVWPWVAVRAVSCRLTPEVDCVHEGDRCHLALSVRNVLPMPVWGLAVEGFLDRVCDEGMATHPPTAALAYVRPWAVSTYRFGVQPELRGHYPDGVTSLTCSFPFGIWTARRRMGDVLRVTVWPKVYPITGQTALTGRRRAETGDGNRIGRCGDIVGVREYRLGDAAKQVNWVATARADRLIVSERSGPECPRIHVVISDQAGSSRAELADRIRVAASLMANLHRSSIPLRIRIGNRQVIPRVGRDGFVQIMNALTDVPIDGVDQVTRIGRADGHTMIAIDSDADGNPRVSISDPGRNHRVKAEHDDRVIRRDLALDDQLLALWTEVRDANLVA
ncbi:DUF58 domain-containing protein [Crateriforma conspicua]|uniref:DUF58 domain-containing protein n=1 Tax=Crateriforma conspicua TaxID=2527996 RepID=UPI001189B51C|nr:DUF58 domain-containing protein [Crateriforma conspicua]QDV65179.1 hypothetical protein Mal65_43490 [Crateriforma conspicua]